jgi:hypothetical protein
MYRKVVVGMVGDAVMLRTRLIQWVDVHADLVERAHVVKELMTDFLGDGIPLGHRQLRGDRNTHFRLEGMTDPAGPHVCERLYPWDVRYGMPKLADHLRIHPI